MSPPLRASIVLPTHGRRDSLLRVLRALGCQTVGTSAFEVVVVCDGDIDGTVAACLAYAQEAPYRLQVITQDNQGPTAARNRGVAESRAPLIIFIDDDVVPADDLLASHLAAHDGQDMLVTIGPLLPPHDHRLNPWEAWEERTLCRQYDEMEQGRWMPTYRQFYTGNASVLKRHIEDIGGFDPSFHRAEDIELALRLRDHGLHFAFLPHARGWHYVRRTLSSWLGMSLAYGAADAAMAQAGRPETLSIVGREFWGRNKTIRILTLLCVGHPRVMRIIRVILTAVLEGGRMDRGRGLGIAVCSIVFNLSYYHGLAMALGGRTPFVTLLREHRPLTRTPRDRPMLNVK